MSADGTRRARDDNTEARPDLVVSHDGGDDVNGARGLARGGASGGFPIWEVAFAFLGKKWPYWKRRFHFLAC